MHETSLKKVGSLAAKDRASTLAPLLRSSYQDAAADGDSLTLIRPISFSLGWKRKADGKLTAERVSRAKTLAQGSLLEKELAVLEPCPFEIFVTFTDASGKHRMKCGDWETPATFFKWRREYGDEGALRRLKARYEDDYPAGGVVFAMGTMAKYPKTWMLLGLIRLDESAQMKLI